MKTYSVSFDVEISDDVPLEDVEAFLEFELGSRGYISLGNALFDSDLQALNVSNVWVS